MTDKKYDSIIFDIDGTLWDATEILSRVWSRASQEIGDGRKISPDDMKSVMGRPFEGCVEKLFSDSKFSNESIRNAITKASKDTFDAQGGKYYPGVKEGIPRLAKVYDIFLVSNCGSRYLKVFLEFSGLETSIKGYDCYGMSGLSKGEMINGLKNKFSLKSPVYVGDTASDAEAAAFSKSNFIFAAYGFGKVENPELSFDNFEELFQYFAKS